LNRAQRNALATGDPFQRHRAGYPGDNLASFREQCRNRAWGETEQALAKERTKFAPKFKAPHADMRAEPPT
jgi:hypothetical protein